MLLNLQNMSLQQIFIYFIAAVGPAALLMFYVYKKDGIEKEPGRLLLKLLGGGVLAAAAAYFLEQLGMSWLENYLATHPISYSAAGFLEAALVAVIEELTKFIFLYWFSWQDPAFNYRFDGIVYAVFVSLGFAAAENVLYIFSYDSLSLALPRALMAIPGHMGFSVYMGLLYGMAKVAERRNQKMKCDILLVLAYLSGVILHWTYDGSIMMDTNASTMFFFAFIIVMDIAMAITIKQAAKHDERIY